MKNKKNIFEISFIFFFLIFSLSIISSSDEDITFIALGHVYPDYEALNSSISLINSENPDFVIFLGDSLIDPYHKDWEIFKEIIDKIYAPVYFAPGNHDIPENGSKGGYFLGTFSNSLFTNLTIKGKTFIILNSVTDKEGVYDISNEQVDFIRDIYENDNNNKFIFMHHCLFYNYDNQFCNSREFFKENNWNEKVVPIIKDRTIAVFVGDTGVNEPYFSYIEDNISYLGIGFSPKESQLKIPPHFLKVSLKGRKLEVTPIPIRQDLIKVKYYQRIDKRFFPLFKSFIRKNLGKVLLFFSILVFILFLIIFFFLIQLRRIKSQKSFSYKFNTSIP